MSEKRPVPVVVDVETTGFASSDRIVEIAAVQLDPETWQTVDEYDTLVQPERDVGPTGVHGITASMVELAPTFGEIVADVARLLHGSVIVAHNLPFDFRLLRSEFERLGVTIDMGSGICTLRATRQRLEIACKDRRIDLTHRHRALGDARATADLARVLGFRDACREAMPVRIGYVRQSPGQRTMRRGLAAAETSPMPRIVSRSRYPHCDEAVCQYLDALDWVLDDGVIDASERAAIRQLADEWNIPERARLDAHRSYFDNIVAAAKRDGIITRNEREVIANIARQLEIPDADIPAETAMPEVPELGIGSRICFTGEAIVNGERWERDRLTALAAQAGFETVPTVTKKACDLLVAADVSSVSGKAKTARRFGIPIMSVSDFVAAYRPG